MLEEVGSFLLEVYIDEDYCECDELVDFDVDVEGEEIGYEFVLCDFVFEDFGCEI